MKGITLSDMCESRPACMYAHRSMHMSACANSQIDTRSPNTLCDLRWPMSAVLGSSAKTGKKGATLTETQARLASGSANYIHHGHLDVSPSGDRE